MTAVAGPFAEALRATFQPCTVLLVVPTVTAVVAGRARWQGTLAAAASLIVGGWILLDNRFVLEGWMLRASAGLVVVALVALVVFASPEFRGRVPAAGPMFQRPWPQAALVGAITLAASLWWRPCVGEQLGAILNGAQEGIGGQLVPMAAYMLGTFAPVALVVAVRYAADPPARLLATSAWFAAAAGIVVAGALVAGRHGDVVVTLTRWTLE